MFIRKNLWRRVHVDPTEDAGRSGAGTRPMGPGRKARDMTLRRFWYSSEPSKTLAFAEDYAYMIEGILDLYEVTDDQAWLEWAVDLQSECTPTSDHGPGA